MQVRLLSFQEIRERVQSISFREISDEVSIIHSYAEFISDLPESVDLITIIAEWC
jgi:hypothetical protein